MLSTDSLVRELFLVCQLAIGYQLAKNQLASNRPIGNWCQLASNWPIGLDWQLAGRARFFWIGLAIGWPTKNYLSNWATLLKRVIRSQIFVNNFVHHHHDATCWAESEELCGKASKKSSLAFYSCDFCHDFVNSHAVEAAAWEATEGLDSGFCDVIWNIDARS